MHTRRSGLSHERDTTNLLEVLDRVRDRGIVVGAWIRVSLLGIDSFTLEARVIVASLETHLKYAGAIGNVGAPPRAAA